MVDTEAAPAVDALFALFAVLAEFAAFVAFVVLDPLAAFELVLFVPQPANMALSTTKAPAVLAIFFLFIVQDPPV